MARIGREQDQITTGSGVDGGGAPSHDDGVAARPPRDDVVARPHVNVRIAAAPHKAVVARRQDVGRVVAKIRDAAHSASGKLIVACATDDSAACGTAQDQEAVVACTTVDVEHRIHTFRDVVRVVACTTTGINFLDTGPCITILDAQRAHQVLVSNRVVLHRGGFVGDVVVSLVAVAPRRITGVEHQGTVILQVADLGRIGPRPEVTARDRNAHDRDTRGQVGARWRDVDHATKACQGEIDVDDTDVQREVE